MNASTSREALALMRAPLVLTAVADVWVGFHLASRTAPWSLEPVAIDPTLWAAAAASAFLYLAGMVLNDLFDLDRDRTLYPDRPLPAGRISVPAATAVALMLTTAGLLAAAAAGLRAFIGASVLLSLILLYDGGLKKIRFLGPLTMGSCRATNLMLGFLAAGAAFSWLAVWYGAYIFLVTRLSEEEDTGSVTLRAGRAARLHVGMLFLGMALLLVVPLPHGAAIGLVWVLGYVHFRTGRLPQEPLPKEIGKRVLALLEVIPLIGATLLLGHGLWLPGLALTVAYPLYFLLRVVVPSRSGPVVAD